ncbi:cytochrome oxidase putative small subunit CydP [Chitinasiproducens palmae]|nr:cytochrome oxidase putative small subunit CydP [Chitinasiproducens palmae]
MSASPSEPLASPTVAPPRRSTAWWRKPLAREIGLLLVCKLILLLVMRALFFSHPAAPHMRLPSDTVARALLGPSSTAAVPGTRAAGHLDAVAAGAVTNVADATDAPATPRMPH